jgi:ABC-type sugar transport system permease subunit
MKEIKLPKEMIKNNRIVTLQIGIMIFATIIVFLSCVVGMCLLICSEYNNNIQTYYCLPFLIPIALYGRLWFFLDKNGRFYCHNTNEWEEYKKEIFVEENKKWVI